MLEVEFVGSELIGDRVSLLRLRSLCDAAAAAAGINDGHVAIEFVDEQRIAQLNAAHRGRPQPTDVLSFPIDGVEPLDAPVPSAVDGAQADDRAHHLMRELGDVVICPVHTSDLSEAVVHGMLHLLGMDHETDDGEMLSLQGELLRREAS